MKEPYGLFLVLYIWLYLVSKSVIKCIKEKTPGANSRGLQPNKNYETDKIIFL